MTREAGHLVGLFAFGDEAKIEAKTFGGLGDYDYLSVRGRDINAWAPLKKGHNSGIT